MRRSRCPDVLVIGGGPTGLAVAICSRLQALDTVILEPAAGPIDKPCGEGLMPDALECLDAMGVQTRDLGFPFVGVSYVDHEQRARGVFPGVAGRGVRRTELHARLSSRASDLGVRTVREKALGLERSEFGWAVRTQNDLWTPRWIGGCDGLRSSARVWCGLASSSTSGGRAGMRFGVRRHYRVEPWSDTVEVYWDRGVEAYVTPIGPSETGVAILWRGGSVASATADEGAKEGGRGPVFDRLLRRFDRLGRRLAHAEPTSRAMGTGPLLQLARRAHSHNLALVGDAAGYRDAITGEGLALAFRQALAFGQALKAGSLAGYERAYRRIVRRANLLVRLALTLSTRPRLRRRILVAFAREPSLFDGVLAIHVGAAGNRLALGTAARLGRRLAFS